MWRRSWPRRERERQWQICACSGWPRATKKDRGLSTKACERSPTRDVSRCGCGENARARIDTLRPTRTTQIEKGEQTGTWVHQVARAMEEQLREDQEGLETHEQKRKTEDAKRRRGIVHDNNKNKRLSCVQHEMGNIVHHIRFLEP